MKFSFSIRSYLILGFSFFLAISGIMAYSQYKQVASSKKVVDSISQRSHRIQLVTGLVDAARHRSILSTKLFLTEDPFDRDDLRMDLMSQAVDFIKNREKLKKISNQPMEKLFLKRQGELTGPLLATHNRFLDLVSVGDSDSMAEARDIFFDNVMPQQNKVIELLLEMVAYERNSIQQILDREHLRNTENSNLHFFLIIGIFLMASVVSALVIRKIASMEGELFSEKDRVSTTLESIRDAVITTDKNGTINFFNPAAEKMFKDQKYVKEGCTAGKLAGLVREGTEESLGQIILNCAQGGDLEGYTGRMDFTKINGAQSDISASVAPLHSKDGNVIGSVIVAQDITKTRALMKKVEYQANYDQLTGLMNRYAFETELTRTLTYESGEHALCLMDLDRFKVVNDTCGHAAGDKLLKQLAERLRPLIRRSDTFARLGGDEFGIILRDCPIDKAKSLAENVLKAVQQMPFFWEGERFHVGASIGVLGIKGPMDMQDAMKKCDTACYFAKDGGRNRVSVYTQDDDDLTKAHDEMSMVQRINSALEDDRLVLHYQPIQGIQEDCKGVKRYEALLRLVDEDGKLIPPGAFLPSAERYDLMPKVDRAVLLEAMKQMASCKAAGGQCIYCVNLSGQTFRDDSFKNFAVEQIQASGIDPSRLCFEITETAAIANLEAAKDFMETLQEMGCLFALDDFGSGLSSFGYLKELPIDYLKIDGQFVIGLKNDSISKVMVEAIHKVGNAMGIKTIAEFVGDEETLQILKEMGVDYAQGFYIGKPTPLTLTDTGCTVGEILPEQLS